jgi:hypothetical protein
VTRAPDEVMCASDRLAALAPLLADVRALVEERVDEPVAPRWVEERGWDAFLIGLDDATVAIAEERGLLPALASCASCPASLADLAWRVAEAVAVDEPPPVEAKASFELPHASDRKRGQIASMVASCVRLGVRPRRVVDVGAGRGHLSRELARVFDVPVIALERDEHHAKSARRFGTADVRVQEVGAEVPLERGDLAIGLHACGALGDSLVVSAAAQRAHAVLVSCCFQKIRSAARESISRAGLAADVCYRREHLGLANLAPGVKPIEASVRRSLDGRATRRALRLLLESRGLALGPSEESRGINRRKMLAGLAVVAPKALADRGLAPPTTAELAAMEARAASDYAIMRRYNLPRIMVGRLLELAIVLDRAARFEESGHRVEVSRIFTSDLSPRNLGIVAVAP